LSGTADPYAKRSEGPQSALHVKMCMAQHLPLSALSRPSRVLTTLQYSVFNGVLIQVLRIAKPLKTSFAQLRTFCGQYLLD
jgi:hypothetical protein